MSCSECVFRGVFQDMGASCDVCNLYHDLVDAITACNNSENCRHRFTVAEARAIVIEREGNLPVLRERKQEVREPLNAEDATDVMRDALTDLATSIAEALTPALQSLQDSLKVFNEE